MNRRAKRGIHREVREIQRTMSYYLKVVRMAARELRISERKNVLRGEVSRALRAFNAQESAHST